MVSAMKQLEDYVIAMANRTEEADIHEQLMQKEKDLLLAAELGKALLEKNEELSRQNERITEEYTQKLEVRTHSLFHMHTLKNNITNCFICITNCVQSM